MAKQQRELKNIYKSIRPHVKAATQCTLITPDFYEMTLKAALAKTFDFNALCYRFKFKLTLVLPHCNIEGYL